MRPGGRRWPTACRCMPRAPTRCRTCRARTRGDLHQRAARRRLPRLRRAAGGDRAGGADGRAGRAARASTRWSSACAMRSRAGDATATGQVLGARRRRCRDCLEALRPHWQRRCATRPRRSTRRRAARCGAASASPACGTARQHLAVQPLDDARSGSRRDGALTLLSAARSTSARARTPSSPRSPPTRWACRSRAFDLVARRHRPDARCRQDLGLAPDLRLRQCGASSPAQALRARRSCALANAGAGRDARARRRGASWSRDGGGRRTLDLAGLPRRRRRRRAVRRGHASIRRPRRSTTNGQGVPYATYGFAAQMARGRGRPRARHGASVLAHRRRARRRPRDQPDAGRGPDPGRHRAGPRPGADGGVSCPAAPRTCTTT